MRCTSRRSVPSSTFDNNASGTLKGTGTITTSGTTFTNHGTISPGDNSRNRDAINADPEVEALIHMKTLYLGPDELLVGAKVAFAKSKKLADVASSINALESSIRAAVPAARVIYIEPDVYVPMNDGHPSTDSIVIKGTD